jgi:hypothetical protein
MVVSIWTGPTSKTALYGLSQNLGELTPAKRPFPYGLALWSALSDVIYDRTDAWMALAIKR